MSLSENKRLHCVFENCGTEQSCPEQNNRYWAVNNETKILFLHPDSDSDNGYLNGVGQSLEEERLTVRKTAFNTWRILRASFLP